MSKMMLHLLCEGCLTKMVYNDTLENMLQRSFEKWTKASTFYVFIQS